MNWFKQMPKGLYLVGTFCLPFGAYCWCMQKQSQPCLLDEWDANLDANNRALAEQCIQTLSARAVVVEISHRDSTHA